MKKIKKRANKVDVYVGQRVRQRRMMLGISLQRMAEAIGVTYQQTQRYETGANRIGAGRLHAIALALEVPIEHFFEGLPTSKRPADEKLKTVSPSFSSSQVVALNASFIRIKDSAVRREIVGLVGLPPLNISRRPIVL